jgi:hypothetical protein
MFSTYVYLSSHRNRGRRHCKFLISKAGYYDMLALRISRFWNMEPTWFFTLDYNVQLLVLAEYRLSHEDEKKRKDRKVKNERAIIKRNQERIQNRGNYYE